MKKYLNLIIVLLLILITGIIVYILLFKNSKMIKFNKNSLNLYVGESEKIAIIKNNTKENNFIWKSNDESIATVNEEGLVEGISQGSTKIVLESNKGQELASCIVNVLVIDVKDIEVTNSKLELEIGSKKLLELKIIPENATRSLISFESSDDSIVRINQEGMMEARNEGEVIITVKSNNGITKTCLVQVKNNFVNVTTFFLNKNNLSMEIGQSETLIATIKPDNATNKSITWESSNTSVVEVDQNGKVTAKNNGSVTITAKASNGFIATCHITVVNNTYNKSAIFFGDSITQGGDGSWAKYIRDNYDLKEVINAGVSDARLANKNSNKWLVNIVQKYQGKNYDYVILHGGINDVWSGTTIGEYDSNDFSGNYDTKTVLGGLETYIYTVKKLWPNAKIGYIINYSTPNKKDIYDNEPYYYPKMMEVLRKWNISYINLYSGTNSSGQFYSNLLEVKTNKYVSDGVHLNRKGYELISPFIYEWMKTL